MAYNLEAGLPPYTFILQALLVAATVAAVVAFRASLWAWATMLLSLAGEAPPRPALRPRPLLAGAGGRGLKLRRSIREGIAM